MFVRTMKSRYTRPVGLLVLLVTLLSITVPSVGANEVSDISSTKGFRKAVTLAGIRAHQAAFQAIADANNGTRAAGTPGYDASAQYVYDKMVAAGYQVTRQEFSFTFPATAQMQRISPNPTTYRSAVDVNPATLSANGDVTGVLRAVDINPTPQGLPDGTSNSSGCEAADFAGFVAGSIALVQRGTCGFGVKAFNAEAAGAIGVIIMNEGNSAARSITLANFTLTTPGITIPVVGTSFSIGLQLYNSPSPTIMRIAVIPSGERVAENIIAETPQGDPNRVIVIGAHLDSVLAGPGINDNGSGSATNLEVAEVFASQMRDTRNKLRFAWWGAEELGLIGSTYYVSQLDQDEIDQIELNLNFDMLNSPNYVRFVYDGDNSAFPVGPNAAKGPAGSGEIERVFHAYFASQNLASKETPFSGRSDYGPFIAVGIPAGGLFTGAEGIKTAAEAQTYGGVSGQAYDQCYHQACDTFAGTNTDYARQGLDEMSDAVAHSVLTFSKRNFAQQPLHNPAAAVSGTSSGGSGGGLHSSHDTLIAR